MAKYDLTGSLEREFTFNIGSEEFVFHKPTVRQMRTLSTKFAAINKEDDAERQAELSEEAMAEMYTFINNTRADGPHIADVLEDEPVSVQVKFNEMIQKELGASS